MRRKLLSMLLLAVVLVTPLLLNRPQETRAQANCEFVLGFQTLHDLIPEIVGNCIENEWHNAENGDGLQRTTNGLLVWRKFDNWTAFTDGFTTWINGPLGLQARLNTERFPWESAAAIPTPPPTGGEVGGGVTEAQPDTGVSEDVGDDDGDGDDNDNNGGDDNDNNGNDDNDNGDNNGPTVESTDPGFGETDVELNTNVTVTFSERLDPNTVTSNTFFLTDPGDNTVSADVSYNPDGRTATLNPVSNLAANTTYQATVLNGPGGITDRDGNPLPGDFSWSFTTGAAATTLQAEAEPTATATPEPTETPRPTATPTRTSGSNDNGSGGGSEGGAQTQAAPASATATPTLTATPTTTPGT